MSDGKYTREELNTLSKEVIVELFLSLQGRFDSLDEKMQLLLEQVAVSNQKQFGCSSEKFTDENQLMFKEDGTFGYFNEAEAIAATDEDSEEFETKKQRGKKKKGKRDEDFSGLPIELFEHRMSDEELDAVFGKDGYKTLPDEIYKRYSFTPAKIGVEEHRVGVYSSKKDDTIVKAKHPGYMFRNSPVSPSLEAALLTSKYVNGMPFYRQEQDLKRYGINITRKNMADWTIMSAERYFSVICECLMQTLLKYHVIHADETPVLVNKDGRPAGSKSYMWVYRTGKIYKEKPIIIYDYQTTRSSNHPAEFLSGFEGVCITDGYQVYHTIEKQMEGLKIAGCWAHARRRYDEALKALPKASKNKSLAHMALKQIQLIYKEEDNLKNLDASERLRLREKNVKPLVEAYFSWVRENQGKVPAGSKTDKGFTYSLNQESYLKVFLEDGEVEIDNNACEAAIRGFCVGKKNWVMIDTIAGAKASAIIYSLAETAKANNLKPYEYFKYLLEIIPRHMDDYDMSFCQDLLPWSEKLPEYIKK